MMDILAAGLLAARIFMTFLYIAVAGRLNNKKRRNLSWIKILTIWQQF